MKKNILFISALLMLLSCGGKKTQAVVADAADSVAVSDSKDIVVDNAAQKKDMEAATAFVEQFYKEWSKEDILDYDYVKKHITPNFLQYLVDANPFDTEGECLATWEFFYEGGGDVGELKSRKITARDEKHVLVESKYVNYEYDILLTVVKEGDAFKIDSLEQKRSEFVPEN